jgi:sugar lactone lactonase YvrE
MQDIRWNLDNSLLYVADYGNSRIRVVNPSTGDVSTLAASVGNLFHPEGMDFIPNGDLYVGDVGNNRIVKFPAGGGFSVAWPDTHLVGGAVRYCPADGLIYYNRGLNALSKRATDGTGFADLRTDFTEIEGIAFISYDGTYDLIVSDYGAGALYRVSRTFPYPRTLLASGLGSPEGIDMYGQYAYFADRSAGAWRRYDVANAALDTVASTADGLVQPTGSSISGNKQYLGDHGGRKVWVLSIDEWRIGSIG